MAAVLVVASSVIPASAKGQARWNERTGLRVEATAGIAPAGGYARYHTDDAGRAFAWGGGGDFAAHYVFANVFGIGAHLGAGVRSVELPEVSNGLLLVDVGPSLLARLVFTRFEATLRVPLGFSVMGASGTHEQTTEAGEVIGGASTSNELGLGMHAGLLFGTAHWFRDALALRLELGPTFHTLARDEVTATYLASPGGQVVIDEERRRVFQTLWSMEVRIGIAWRAR